MFEDNWFRKVETGPYNPFLINQFILGNYDSNIRLRCYRGSNGLKHLSPYPKITQAATSGNGKTH